MPTDCLGDGTVVRAAAAAEHEVRDPVRIDALEQHRATVPAPESLAPGATKALTAFEGVQDGIVSVVLRRENLHR